MRLYHTRDLSPVQNAAIGEGGIGHFPGFFSDPTGELYYGGNVGNEPYTFTTLPCPSKPIFKAPAGTQQNSQSWVTLANGEVVTASYGSRFYRTDTANFRLAPVRRLKTALAAKLRDCQSSANSNWPKPGVFLRAKDQTRAHEFRVGRDKKSTPPPPKY